MKKKDKFMKIFTIILVIIFLAVTFWTSVVIFWPSWNVNKQNDNLEIYTNNNLTWSNSSLNLTWNNNLTGSK